MEATGVGRRNQRGEGGGGSLSGDERREVGSVWGETQGLLAWVLVEALFSTHMINTQVSALYFGGKLYLCFQYFSEIACISSVQFCSVIQSCPTLCNPMDCSKPGLPVHHQLAEFTQTHVHPTISFSVIPFSSYLKLSQHQGLVQ